VGTTVPPGLWNVYGPVSMRNRAGSEAGTIETTPPVTFAVCGLTALHYLELATRTRPEAIRIPDTKLGWEGRMFIAGIGGIVGIATVAYLALAAYLVLLIGAGVLAGRLVAREGGYR